MSWLLYAAAAGMQRSRYNKNKHNEIYEFAYRSTEIAIVQISTSWANAIILKDKDSGELIFSKMNSSYRRWIIKNCPEAKYIRLREKSTTVRITELMQFKNGKRKLDKLKKNKELDDLEYDASIAELKVELLLQRF